MKILTLLIRKDKKQQPKQTEFRLKQPLTEDTPSGIAQPCEHQPLLHRLTNKTIKNTHKRQKIKTKRTNKRKIQIAKN